MLVVVVVVVVVFFKKISYCVFIVCVIVLVVFVSCGFLYVSGLSSGEQVAGLHGDEKTPLLRRPEAPQHAPKKGNWTSIFSSLEMLRRSKDGVYSFTLQQTLLALPCLYSNR